IARERLPAGLRFPGVSVPPSAHQTNLMAMLELLAGARPFSRAETGPWPENDAPKRVDDPVGLPYGASIVVIAGRLTEEWAKSLEVMRHGNWRPSVLLVDDEPRRIPGVPVWAVRADRELAEALEGGMG
ncbi:MAG TPA: hypothetical protein VIA81_04900, partial [Acidimicrobiia bacterium]